MGHAYPTSCVPILINFVTFKKRTEEKQRSGIGFRHMGPQAEVERFVEVWFRMCLNSHDPATDQWQLIIGSIEPCYYLAISSNTGYVLGSISGDIPEPKAMVSDPSKDLALASTS